MVWEVPWDSGRVDSRIAPPCRSWVRLTEFYGGPSGRVKRGAPAARGGSEGTGDRGTLRGRDRRRRHRGADRGMDAPGPQDSRARGDPPGRGAAALRAPRALLAEPGGPPVPGAGELAGSARARDRPRDAHHPG